MDLSNLNSLKVADLKQVLKSRGLSLVGNKSELIQRVESSLMNQTGKSITDKEIIDEDAILGGDDDANFSKTDDSLLHNEDLLLSETPAIVTATNLITSKNVLTKKMISVKSPETKEDPNVTSAVATTPVAIKPTAQQTSGTSISTKTTALSNTSSFQTPDERKQQRLLKFGDPKIKDRAERFGLPVNDPAVNNEGSKIKQRAERFGEVVSTKAKVLVEKERIDKRKERFGSVSNNGTSSTLPIGLSPSINTDQAILKRQQRFNFVKQTENKPLNGNNSDSASKRRRFAF